MTLQELIDKLTAIRDADGLTALREGRLSPLEREELAVPSLRLSLEEATRLRERITGDVHGGNREACLAAFRKLEDFVLACWDATDTACDPTGACTTHGRCWTHSDWEDGPTADRPSAAQPKTDDADWFTESCPGGCGCSLMRWWKFCPACGKAIPLEKRMKEPVR